jgi:serpin B
MPIAAVLLLAATVPPAASPTPPPEVPEMRAFALDLYAGLREEPGNLALSPWSVASALVPLADGARGATRVEIEKALHLPRTWEESRARWLEALAALDSRTREGVDLDAANALWVARAQRLLPAFVEGLSEGLDVEVERADFAGDPAGTEATINRFVSEGTRGKIPQLVSNLDPRTRLLIVNAVYFKGLWASPFEKERTETLPFTGSSGASAPRPFLRKKEELRYFEDADLQALELPYRGGKLRMLLLLPTAKGGLPAVERTLDRVRYDAIVAAMWTWDVDVSIPKFKIESSFERSFVRALDALGMKTAFTEGADFSGMTGARDLFVSRGIHKVFVAIDEEGTEAAAATGVGMRPVSVVPSARFTADHPFLFVIWDAPTGTILFLGRVESP